MVWNLKCFSANILLRRGGIWNLAQTPRKSLKYHESGVMDKMLHNAMWIQIACFSLTDSKLWSFTLRKDHSTKHLFGFEKHIRCRLKFSSLSSPGNSIFPITTFFCISLWDFVVVLIGLPSVDLWWQYQFTSSSRYSPPHCYHWIISSGYEQIRNINGALDHEIPYCKMQYHTI